jgi:heat-inducible transcriptional repressor
VKNIDHSARRNAVLVKTISRYIKDAEPVSSQDMSRSFNLSSATIRNIFSELEDAGYLTHPYTSGGRIPTQKGYRFYVNYLADQMELLDADKESISTRLKKGTGQIEEILDVTSNLVSQITHYASIVSDLERQDRFLYKGLSFILAQPEFHDAKRIRLLIKLLEEKQKFLEIINQDFENKINILIGEELECREIEDCSLVVSTYYIKDKPMGRLAVLGPTRMEYGHIIPTLEYASDVLSITLKDI